MRIACALTVNTVIVLCAQKLEDAQSLVLDIKKWHNFNFIWVSAIFHLAHTVLDQFSKTFASSLSDI